MKEENEKIEENRFKVLEIKKDDCLEQINMTRPLAFWSTVATGGSFALSILAAIVFFQNHSVDENSLGNLSGLTSVGFGCLSIMYLSLRVRIASHNANLKKELEDIKLELESLKENNLEDPMRLGR